MTIVPSAYQEAVFEEIKNGKGHLIVAARAGSAKSTTLKLATERMPSSANVLIMAFGKDIAEELKKKITHPQAKIATFNGYGYSAIRSAARGKSIKIDDGKTSTLIKSNVPEDFTSINFTAIAKLVGTAKAYGIVPNGTPGAKGLMPDTMDNWLSLMDRFDIYPEFPEGEEGDYTKLYENFVGYVRVVLKASIMQTMVIDFNDQLYLPVVLGLRFFKYDFVLVDEAQDVSPIQREIVRRSLAPGTGRAIFVGDDFQAIYGFRGADVDSMKNIIDDFKPTVLSLPICYRCCKSVIELAQTIVSDIQAADDAPVGLVEVRGDYNRIEKFGPTDMVLCRNTAPLIKFAFHLLARKIACRVLGRDIGTNIVNRIQLIRGRSKKAKSMLVYGEGAFIDKMEAWQKKMIEQYTREEKMTRVESINDQVESIRAFAENTKSETVDQLIEEVKELFANQDGRSILLSSVHKSKGLEEDTVWILDAHLMPSKMARKNWQKKQEENIRYVAYTRAKSNLFFITTPK